jgi:hypothetical protein
MRESYAPEADDPAVGAVLSSAALGAAEPSSVISVGCCWEQPSTKSMIAGSIKAKIRFFICTSQDLIRQV